MFNFSKSEENYIKSIYHLQQYGNVTTTGLSKEISTRPASVTDMIKKLTAKGIVQYEAYKGFKLTQEGKKIALLIIRRHRLWEFFLSEKLHFSWSEVHSLAEDLEHVSSTILIDKLDAYLGFPRHDPHGDPIPDASGRIEAAKNICINQLPVNTPAIVCQVKDQSQAMLELLHHKKILIGTQLTVKQIFHFDHSVELKIKNQLITISKDLAKNIFVSYEAA